MLEPCLSHCTQNWILFQKLFQYSLLKSSQASYLPASPAMVDQRFVYSQDLVHCCGVCCLGGRLCASGFQRIWQSMSQMCSHKISWKTHNLSPELQERTLSTHQISDPWSLRSPAIFRDWAWVVSFLLPRQWQYAIGELHLHN